MARPNLFRKLKLVRLDDIFYRSYNYCDLSLELSYRVCFEPITYIVSCDNYKEKDIFLTFEYDYVPVNFKLNDSTTIKDVDPKYKEQAKTFKVYLNIYKEKIQYFDVEYSVVVGLLMKLLNELCKQHNTTKIFYVENLNDRSMNNIITTITNNFDNMFDFYKTHNKLFIIRK